MTATIPVEVEIDIDSIRNDVVDYVTKTVFNQLKNEISSGQLIRQIKKEIKADIISQYANQITEEVITPDLQNMIKEASLKSIANKVSNLSIKIQ